MIILGIDPGTATTGFGLIEIKQREIECLDFGVIETSPKLEMPERLKKIHKDLNKIIKDYDPKLVAVESLFFFKNIKTAIPVSQARGVIILTVSQKNIPIQEFTPLQAKTAVVGYGRATKKQVQKMVQNILNMEKVPKPDDAADALAIAVCCAQFNSSLFKQI